MDEPRRAPPTAATNPFLSGNFAPVEAETTCFDLEVHGGSPRGWTGDSSGSAPTRSGRWTARFHWFVGTGMAHGLRLRGGRASGIEPVRARREGRPGAGPHADRPGAGGRDGEVDTDFTTAARQAQRRWSRQAACRPARRRLESVARSDFGGTLEAGFARIPGTTRRPG